MYLSESRMKAVFKQSYVNDVSSADICAIARMYARQALLHESDKEKACWKHNPFSHAVFRSVVLKTAAYYQLNTTDVRAVLVNQAQLRTVDLNALKAKNKAVSVPVHFCEKANHHKKIGEELRKRVQERICDRKNNAICI